MTADLYGLFGGTFDPPHNGHVAALRAAWASGRYRMIEVVVSNEPYQKLGDRTVTNAQRRLAMAHAAFDALDGVIISDRELQRGGPSFTIDTVREINDPTLELIVGQDAAAGLPTWRDADVLATLVTVAIVPRSGAPAWPSKPWRCVGLEMASVDLSSTSIRQQIDEGEDVSGQVPWSIVNILRTVEG
jgi:nicotinate-nucleotide adenylyltransferase